MSARHEHFMRIALEEARLAREEGNMAVGAVIARDDRVLWRAHNEVASTFDVTAHAETAAVRGLAQAWRALNPTSQANSGPLAGATLYTTVEPCPMCCWIACVSGLGSIVMGARHAELRIPFGRYTVEQLVELTARNVTLVSGILSEECAAMARSGRFTPGPR